MANVLFISEGRLKKLTSIHENVEPDDIMPFVIQAQDIYIQDVLGTKFYNNLKLKVSGNTTNTNEKELLNDYIAPTLANYSLWLAFPHLNYKIKNKALLQGTSEEAITTDLNVTKYVRGSIEDTAQFYRERLRKYLEDFSINFPDYINPGTDGMQPNKNNAYFHGVHIPHPIGCGWENLKIDPLNTNYL